MIKKVYSIRQEHYDYFGGHKFNNSHFDTLLEAWEEYKRLKKFSYSYDDGSFSKVEAPCGYFEYVPDPVARYHARSKYEWEDELDRRYAESHFGFHEDEVKYLISLVTPSFDIDDEDIYI